MKKSKATKFQPLYNNVLVCRSNPDALSKGGIIIPTAAQEKQANGEVIAIGTGTILDDGSVRPLAVKVGNVVLFGAYAGNEIKIDGEDFLIMRETDILGVIG